MASEDRSGRFVWFLAGAAAGAAAALLFAPQSGRKTRRYLCRKAGEGREALAEAGEEILNRSREFVERGRQLAGEAGDLLERGRKLAGG